MLKKKNLSIHEVSPLK